RRNHRGARAAARPDACRLARAFGRITGFAPDRCLAFLRLGANLLRLAILPLRGGYRLPLHVGNAIGAAGAERLEVTDPPTRAGLLVLAAHRTSVLLDEELVLARVALRLEVDRARRLHPPPRNELRADEACNRCERRLRY